MKTPVALSIEPPAGVQCLSTIKCSILSFVFGGEFVALFVFHLIFPFWVIVHPITINGIHVWHSYGFNVFTQMIRKAVFFRIDSEIWIHDVTPFPSNLGRNFVLSILGFNSVFPTQHDDQIVFSRRRELM